ncbi:MAG: hypothetical protein COU35_04835 [Candidatus Magasanikbacteria bacterium CG10_big_fil_rev_8_21_14_0_10_47_10]|uniref:Uncharacterized protein n=1 Tax=Candidatus Magasanikbacteria bacterium CG10_big_fil_rev_8_21_14_0_10_47_10 TaxID=1974652 RepID=A0A2H0TPC0_9BACT|nr:MAG: hypothetical protein COU35_04835 [Candidatus Magasanikbacteria bacterium CG10_big_fil_rev_8_21_14_0_10_47_10]
MSNSIERLINLARRTGDRLIVHDPIGGKDLVIMDVEQYKQLLDGRESIAEMGAQAFVDKIHRDISIWESNREDDDFLFETTDDLSEDDFFCEPQADTAQSDWEAVGAIMSARKEQPVAPEDVYSTNDAASLENEKEYLSISAQAQRDTQDMSDLLYEFPVMSEDEEMPSFHMHAETPPSFFPPGAAIPTADMDKNDRFSQPTPLEEPVFFEEPV